MKNQKSNAQRKAEIYVTQALMQGATPEQITDLGGSAQFGRSTGHVRRHVRRFAAQLQRQSAAEAASLAAHRARVAQLPEAAPGVRYESGKFGAKNRAAFRFFGPKSSALIYKRELPQGATVSDALAVAFALQLI